METEQGEVAWIYNGKEVDVSDYPKSETEFEYQVKNILHIFQA
jgi:hypothetical protein